MKDCQFSGPLVSEDNGGKVDVQESSGENGRDTYLPSCRHLQAPDFDNGKQQDCKVRDHVDSASCYKDLLVIDAVAWFGRRPQLASRDAWPDFDGEIGEIEEEVE